MRITLFDPPFTREDLLPLTFTRPCSEIRVGILTIREKWESYVGNIQSWYTEEYLSRKYPFQEMESTVFVNGTVLPSGEILGLLETLDQNQALVREDQLIGFKGNPNNLKNDRSFDKKEYSGSIEQVKNLWDIFALNGEEIIADVERLKPARNSIDDPFTNVYGYKNLYVDQSAEVRASILNAENGPIVIDKNAVIREGSVLYGPLYVGQNSQVSPGSKIRANTTIGPGCKVGGEVNNVVFFGYSNKAHDGFLGNSVIGEWCNLGADTNNSNLKNNYDEVKLWNSRMEKFQKTGRQFCGLIMGDHSKCSINTMFNTGTVAGIGANIFGAGFHANMIPSFSWGGPQGRTTFHINRFFQTAEIVFARRDMKLTDIDREIFEHIYQITEKNRSWEKK